MKITIFEPWYAGLLHLNHFWLMDRVREGVMTREEAALSLEYTVCAGRKLGVREVT